MGNGQLTTAQCDGSEVLISTASKHLQPVAFRTLSSTCLPLYSKQLLVMFKMAVTSRLGLHENSEQSSDEPQTTASADIKHALASELLLQP